MIPDSIRSILKRALKAYGGADGARALQWLDRLPADMLTVRELQVVRLLAQGMTNDEIANALNLSATTVRWYLSRAYATAGVKGRINLALWAIRAGIATVSDEDDEEA